MAKQLVLDELERCRPRPRPKAVGKHPDGGEIEDLVREYRSFRERGMGHTAAIDAVDKTMTSATEKPGTVKQRLWRHFKREKEAPAKAAKRAEDARRALEEYNRKRLLPAFTDV